MQKFTTLILLFFIATTTFGIIKPKIFAQEYGAPGTLKWRFETGDWVRTSPAIGVDGTVYVGSEDRYLYAINPDGTLKWRFKTDSWVYSSPAINSDGTIYVGSQDDYLYAISHNGKMKWRFKTHCSVKSSPAIGADGTIYVGSSDCYLYAISHNGKMKWRFKTGNTVESSPAIGSDGTIYVGSSDCYLYAISHNGKMKWRFKTHCSVKSSPAIGADGTIYVGSCYLYAINPDGTLKWQFYTVHTVESSPSIGSDGTIYVGSDGRYLYAINPNGTLKWRFKTDSIVWSSPAISSDGTIYVGSQDDYLYAISHNGKMKWRFKTGNIEKWLYSSPAIGSDGTIYVGSNGCYFNAIYGEGKGLANSPWPKFHQNNRNTGKVEKLYAVTGISVSRERPSIDFSVSLLENKNIWRGGEKVGFIVTVENNGKGKGDVDIILSGDKYLLKLFGKARRIGKIKPGKTKSKVFSVILPTEPSEKEAVLYIEIKEKEWGESPTKKEPIRVALLPGEKEIVTAVEPVFPAPDAFANRRKNGYALVVGIQDYPRAKKLKYCVRDAEAITYYLKGVFGIPKSNIKILKDTDATNTMLRANINEWLKMKGPKFVVLYYGGHGVPILNQSTMKWEPYLVPHDADPDLQTTLISQEEIIKLLEATGADTILTFFDACFSGEGGRTPELAKKPLGVKPFIPKSKKAVIFTSSSGRQESGEFEKAGHGLFTYYLLLGLKKHADTDKDGWITLGELEKYVKREVKKASNEKQIPEMSNPMKGKEFRIGRWR